MNLFIAWCAVLAGVCAAYCAVVVLRYAVQWRRRDGQAVFFHIMGASLSAPLCLWFWSMAGVSS